MGRRKKEIREFRFYEIPHGEDALVLVGDEWVRVYGHDEFRLHFHNLMEIGICRYGKGKMFMEKEEIFYGDGTITVIPENFPHITISEGLKENFWEYIFFDPSMIVKELYPDQLMVQTDILNALNKWPLMIESEDYENITVMINQICDEARKKEPYYEKKIGFLLRALVLELIRINKNIDAAEINASYDDTSMSFVTKSINYMYEHYSNKILAKELADACSLSETHFRRVFEASMNMSPMDYLNFIRVQKACELMKTSQHQMDVIATMVGFNSQSSFNRNFKKFLGTTPYNWKINPERYENQMDNYRIKALKGW